MIYILRTAYKKTFLVALIAIIISALSVISASAEVRLFTSATDPDDLTDGVYNIVNRQTGQYLDVFDYIYDTEGKAYLAPRSGQNGQDFLVQRQDDGTYILYPQSENGAFSLSYCTDIMESEFISKRFNLSSRSKFTVVPVIENEVSTGYYTVKPARMTDNNLALDISHAPGEFGFPLAGLALKNDSLSQQWQFVKVSNESLDILGGYVNVRMGYTHDIYAKITPEHLIGNLVWESSDPEVAEVNKQGIVTGISEGTSTITVTCGDYTDSIVVKVTDLPAYTWYSQHNTSTGGWDADSLAGVAFTTYAGVRKPFFVNGYRTADDWMDVGCKLCSESMILHNLGARLTMGYDLRTNESNNLEADPFTVALANSGSYGININNVRVPNSPILVNHYMINPRFNLDGKAITTQEYYGNNLRHIKELLDVHPEGIVVGMRNAARNTTHYVVFTECLNPDDPYGNFEFRVCDSAASTPELGDNVPFKQSISYVSLGYGYWSIFEYSVYNVVE